jgi:hypothetical protein
MSEFLDAALAFPAVLFTFALVVVIACWLLVLVGGMEVDALDGGEGVGSGASEFVESMYPQQRVLSG